ncbi:GMC family oxidoreductase [Streptomyces sp. NPDC093249]|uniref:GMC family oxidoreductase n=1 Tax=unclassified Streptomyces TaxID=2593676 RepID=UPI0037FB40C6
MPTLDVDYVVVGAGTAGCVLAERLSADPGVTVAVLEGGGHGRHPAIRVPLAFSRLFGTRYDWRYRTLPQTGLDGRSLHWPRGKGLGGCSLLNAQVWARGHRDDYDSWAAEAGPAWSYRETLPYFHRAERRSGTNSDRAYGDTGALWIEELRSPNPTTTAFLRACGEAGHTRLPETNAADNTGYGPSPVTQHTGRRFSCADAYLRPARRRPNLTVLTRVLVHRLTLDGDRVTGVTATDRRGGELHVTARREVVLSAGAVGSPHLLQLSGIGDPEALTEAGITPRVPLPGVGRNLQDHLSVMLVSRCPEPVTLAAAQSPRALASYLLRRRGPLTSNIGEALCFVRTRPDLSAPDIELGHIPAPYLSRDAEPSAEHGTSLAVVLLRPHSRGTLRATSADPTVPPAIDPGYLTDPEGADLATLIRGVRAARHVLEAPSLAPYIGAPWPPGPDLTDDEALTAHIRRTADTTFHPVGTCRMGTGDSTVVDPELRVHHLRGLRVADASVMPSLVRGHPQAPTVMIAERAADLIAR